MDRKSFLAGLRVGLALGRSGRDATAIETAGGRQSAVPTVANNDTAGDHMGSPLREEGGAADAS